jgi:hypothetical protein
MKAQLFSILAAAALLLCMTGCSKDEATPSNTAKLSEQDLVGLWWDEFEYADVTETGQPFTRALLAVKADADHTGCIYLGVFDDSSDEPVAVYGGPEDAGFTWKLLDDGKVQLGDPVTGEAYLLTRADGGSYGSQTTDVASTQLTCAPEKLTMTNASYSGTLVKANAEQAAAIEEMLKNFNTNGNGYEVIGIGEPNVPAGAKRYSGYDE